MHQRVCKGDLTKEITKIRLCIWEVKSDYKRQEEWTQSALFKSGRKYVVLQQNVLQCQTESKTVRQGPGQITEKRKRFFKEIKTQDLQAYE